MGLVFQFFGEELAAIGEVVFPAGGFGAERRFHTFGVGELQGTVDLIGTDVVKELSFPLFGERLPVEFGSLQ